MLFFQIPNEIPEVSMRGRETLRVSVDVGAGFPLVKLLVKTTEIGHIQIFVPDDYPVSILPFSRWHDLNAAGKLADSYEDK